MTSLNSLSGQFVVIRGGCKVLDFVASSDDFFDFLNDNGFILNPKKHSMNEIRKMIYYFLYSEVIQIKPQVQALIDQTKRQLHWDDFYWIGVQVRTGHMPGDEDLNVFLMKSDLAVFEKAAMNRTLKAQRKQRKPVKWLLATDNVKVRDRILKSHPEYFISANCTIRHSLRDILSDKKSEGMLCTLLDSYLLSSCNELVLTLRSTYGILAANRKLDIDSIFVKRGDAQRMIYS